MKGKTLIWIIAIILLALILIFAFSGKESSDSGTGGTEATDTLSEQGRDIDSDTNLFVEIEEAGNLLE